MADEWLAISRTANVRRSQQRPPEVREHAREIRDEPRRLRAVDDAVIVRERQRQHQPRRERLSVPYRLHRAARHAEDRDLRRIDDRRESRAPYAAERADREAPALHVGGAELA